MGERAPGDEEAGDEGEPRQASARARELADKVSHAKAMVQEGYEELERLKREAEGVGEGEAEEAREAAGEAERLEAEIERLRERAEQEEKQAVAARALRRCTYQQLREAQGAASSSASRYPPSLPDTFMKGFAAHHGKACAGRRGLTRSWSSKWRTRFAFCGREGCAEPSPPRKR